LNHRPVSASKRGGEEEGDTFMVSYSALMILLLTFMILMVTLATFKEPRFRQAIGSVKGAFTVLPHSGGRKPILTGEAGILSAEQLARSAEQAAEADSSEKTNTYEETVGRIKQKAEVPELPGLEVDTSEKGFTVRIADELMFAKGSADLVPGILPLLKLVARAVVLRPARVAVVGNTCDLPISTHEFPSNWELSMVRAVNVVHFLQANSVPPESLFAYGMADQSPVVPNDTEEDRRKNRRVDIYVTHNTRTAFPRTSER
jgi:chemotaxis protein MotB